MNQEPKSENQPSNESYWYEWYTSERRFWIEHTHHESLALDKSLLTLSAAAIGFTILLTTELLGVEGLPAWSIIFLLFAWIAFVGSIISVQQSFVHSKNSINAIIDQLDQAYEGSEISAAVTTRIKEADKARTNNNWARGWFIAGIVFTFAFVLIGIFDKIK